MQLKQTITSISGLLGLALSLGAGTANGQVFLMNRGSVPGGDHVNWAVLGDDAYPLSDPFSIHSSLGTVVTVNETGTGLGGSFGGLFNTIRQAGTGLSGGTLGGNFTPGAILLDAMDGGTITLSFPQGIYGGGAQIGVPTPTPSGAGLFTAEIQAFDKNNNPIAAFSRDGTFSSAADNSAPFLGIVDSSPDIYRISFSGLTPHYSVFLDSFDIITAVPEPSTSAQIVLGMLLLSRFVLVRKKCQNAVSQE